MATGTNTGITAQHPEYMRLLPLWTEIRAVLNGKQAVVELKLPTPIYTDTVSGTTKTDHYKIQQRIETYLMRGRLFNATARTHDSYTGMVWSHQPEYELPPAMAYVDDYLRDNVQKVVADVTSTGRYGVLLDSDGVETATKGEQDKGIGVPQWILFRSEQIIYWRENEIRLAETYEKRKGDLDYEETLQIRRLVLIDNVYHNQVWRDNDLVDDVVPTVNGSALNYIPFQYFGSDDNSEAATKPPMHDLASYNIGHFMLDCDNRDNLHYHGQGMTNVFVDDGDEFTTRNPNGLNVGAKGQNQFGKDDRVEILQLEATGAIATEMERDEKRMIMIGAQLVQDTSGNQTLGAKKIEAGASISTLKRISMNVSEGVTQLLNWQAEMTGQTPDIVYTLNTEFITDDMTPEMLTAHLSLVQMGALPLTTLNESARKAGLTKKTDEELEQELGEQAFNVGGTSQDEAAALAANEV
jgi:hypothetical protein